VSEAAFRAAVASVGAATLAALEVLAIAERHLHPPMIPRLRQSLAVARDRLEDAHEPFALARPEDAVLASLHEQLGRAARTAGEALSLFVDPGEPATATARILASLARFREAQSLAYPLRDVLPPFGHWFREQGAPEHAERDPGEPRESGLFTAPGERGDRGGFSLYVPEWWDRETPWPLVVALHGGSGHGREFLWTWLREARSRGFVLLAPTSIGGTWSLDAPGIDAARLVSMLDFVAARWPIDRARVLLTGLSDGATFTLLAGLLADAPYTALAPVSGVLHPASFALGSLDRARGRRIHQVHGALDWLFPVALAHIARDALVAAGAELTYREIGDLSHTYPREANAEILAWFDQTLALAS
jgi:phospholipase/carboxylesterase